MTDTLPVSRSFNPRKNCPFLSSKFKRRCPMHYFYLPVECPLGKNCDDGLCPLSHTKLEVIFHPILHKTKRCSMAVMNVCNFAHRCAFFHNTNDRISSHLSWLVWQKKWNLWETSPEVLSVNFNLDMEVAGKLSYMIESRIESQVMLESLNKDKPILSYLNKETPVLGSLNSSVSSRLSKDEKELGCVGEKSDTMLDLERQLGAMLDMCNTPETTASTLTPEMRTYIKQYPREKEVYTPINKLCNISSLYK
ncbi:hypothetical protein MACK_000745 [Theileria orientalis]|uniref:C3H1-type domain-containing protein n=1 Tax=Theileria orientalis TaxID=68886 RepID=A0A976MAI7_THEOR|nr:hypothetical protein MACK_000745 [Theileria orientalis]